MKQDIGRIRHESRRLIRELGFLKTEFTPAGVSHQQSHTILEIGNYRSLSALDLAHYLNLDKSTISRVIRELEELKLVSTVVSPSDKRKKLISLTAKGEKKFAEINARSDEIVASALSFVTEQDIETIVHGIRIYAAALKRARIHKTFTIRKIRPNDNRAIAEIIQTVMPEFGCEGPGFAMRDAEVENMFAAYDNEKSVYFVLEYEGKLVGGGGIAHLQGGPSNVCELKKMYFLPEARGTGMGREILSRCLSEAKAKNYKKCYLETVRFMTQALRLYDRMGFKKLDRPMGNTGHHSCDSWFMKEL